MGLAKRKPSPDFSRLKTALLGGQPDRVPILEPDINPPVMEAFLCRKLDGLKDVLDFWYEAGYDHYPHFLQPFPGIQNAHDSW